MGPFIRCAKIDKNLISHKSFNKYSEFCSSAEKNSYALKPVRSLRRLTDGKSLQYQQGTNNHIELILPELNSFDIILVGY